MPFWISLKVPLALVAVGVLLLLVVDPHGQASAPFFTLAFFWVLLTGKARKTYWSARLRARATYDERASRTSV